MLVVAEKYQTGFDQPKLCAMYVDRKLDGLQAVQTLSRLNRTYAGKAGSTFVLDFRNTADDIREAFKPFFEATLVEERTDMNQIFDLEHAIRCNAMLDEDEIERFAQDFFGTPDDSAKRIRLEAIVRAAADRFRAEDDPAALEELRQLARSYMRFYSFVAQVVTLKDVGLEKLYAYLSWLVRLLPSRQAPGDIEISDDMLALDAFKVRKISEGSAALAAGDGTRLDPIKGVRRRTLHRGGGAFALGDHRHLQRAPRDELQPRGLSPPRAGEPRDSRGRGHAGRDGQQRARRRLRGVLGRLHGGDDRHVQTRQRLPIDRALGR